MKDRRTELLLMALESIKDWTSAYDGTQESLEVMRMEIQRILANTGI